MNLFTMPWTGASRRVAGHKRRLAHTEQRELHTGETRSCRIAGHRESRSSDILIIWCGSIILASCGCALHHYDETTGTEHIWGFGHMKMRVAPCNEGLRAVVRGTDVFGASLGIGKRESYLTAGWHRTQRLDVIDKNTKVRFEWPSSDFRYVRIGSEFPFAPDANDCHVTNREPNMCSN